MVEEHPNVNVEAPPVDEHQGNATEDIGMVLFFFFSHSNIPPTGNLDLLDVYLPFGNAREEDEVDDDNEHDDNAQLQAEPGAILVRYLYFIRFRLILIDFYRSFHLKRTVKNNSVFGCLV